MSSTTLFTALTNIRLNKPPYLNLKSPILILYMLGYVI